MITAAPPTGSGSDCSIDGLSFEAKNETLMSDTTVKKVDSAHSPKGEMGQIYLVSGKSVAMRLWEEQPGEKKASRSRPYETIGFVIEGRAKLHIEGQTVNLSPGDSYLVPEDADHSYEILEPFTAVEATSPPARVNDRDDG